MRINNIAWDHGSITHIARHGVERTEVEDACFTTNPFVLKTRNNRYFALGQTHSGRYLAIVFEHIGRNTVKIITARAMSETERKLYQRRGRA